MRSLNNGKLQMSNIFLNISCYVANEAFSPTLAILKHYTRAWLLKI